MAQKPVTEKKAAKLNKAIKTLHNFCTSRSCNGCPFKNDDVIIYGTFCKFGSFYPGLWDGLEIKEEAEL